MLKQNTIEAQTNLATYTRTGELKPIDGLTPNRIHHYRRLIYNIVEDAIENAYPIAKKFLPEEMWNRMVDEFISEHPCRHPQLFRMPKEFIEFAIVKEYSEEYDIPYLIDLLHFEWVEVEVHTMKDIAPKYANPLGDIQSDTLIFSPYIKLIHLTYPIHKIHELNMEESLGDYFLLIYRQESGSVQYAELTELTHFLIQNMTQLDLSLDEVLAQFLVNMNKSEQENLINNATVFIRDLLKLGVVQGTMV